MKCRKLSASLISTYKQCPLKYKAQYIDKLKSETHPSALIGTSVHEALELIVKTKKSPNIKEICEKHKTNEVKLVTKLVQDTLKNRYLDHFERIHDVEYKFDFALKDGETEIIGFIDRLDFESDEEAIIIDLKSSKKKFTKKELENNYQAKMYDLAVKRNFPKVKKCKVIFWFVRTQERQLLTFTNEHKKFEDELIEIRKEIIANEEPTPNENNFCMWCVNYQNCPLFKMDGAGFSGFYKFS